jgi:hypothetical protein
LGHYLTASPALALDYVHTFDDLKVATMDCGLKLPTYNVVVASMATN